MSTPTAFHPALVVPSPPRSRLRCDHIADLTRLDELRDAWNALDFTDRFGTVFSSFGFMRPFLTSADDPWSVLVIREGDRVVAVLPVVHAVQRHGVKVARLGAGPLADYTGLLVESGRESEAIPELVAAVAAMPWDVLITGDSMDPRLALLAEGLAGEGTVEVVAETPCPIVELPEDLETYLAGRSRKGRQKLRRYRRALEELPGFGVLTVETDGIDAVLGPVAELWRRRWQRPTDRLEGIVRGVHEEGLLRAHLLNCDAGPIAGNVFLIDPVRRTWSYFFGGMNPEFEEMGPGRASLLEGIDMAIGEGQVALDLLRGAEEYKKTFTRQQRTAVARSVRRATVRNRGVALMGKVARVGRSVTS